MKLLSGLSLAALVVSVLATGDLSGKEYVYKYTTKVYAELDEQHHQHAGVIFKSEVHVQHDKDHYNVKIAHVVYNKLNERVTSNRRPDLKFEHNDVLSEALQKPFEIYFEHGMVDHLKVAGDDPNWSVNLKKGLATMFQLNFHHSDKANKSSNGVEEHHEPAHYFKVMEDSLYGECETMYQVSHDPRYSEHNVLNVTKSINFGHCTKVPYYLFENVNSETCVDCPSSLTNPTRLSDVMHYNIRGNRQDFVIEKIHVESEFTYIPWTQEGEIAYIHTNRTLLLVDEREMKEEFVMEENALSLHDLHFQFYPHRGFKDAVDLKEPTYMYHIFGASADILLVGKQFNDLVNTIIDGSFGDNFIKHRAPVKFAEIVKLVSTLGYEEIEKIYKTYVDEPSDDPTSILHKGQLFMEILSAAGTNPAFLFAKNHLFDPNVLPHVANEFIETIPFTLKESSEALFDEIYNLCESKEVAAESHLQSICYLALSSVVHEHCVGRAYKQHQTLPNTQGAGCTPEDAKKYFNHFVHHFENDEDDQELNMAIKIAGSFGLKEGIEYLSKYVNDDHYPTYFRVSAIWALTKIYTDNSEKVLAELVPVYFNTSENHEVRIAAFGVILFNQPSRAILEAIGVGLHEEHNHQVVSFVSSALNYMAHSEYPCHQGIKKDIQHVLRHVLRVDSVPDFDFKHSQYMTSTVFHEDFGVGGLTELSYVTSNDSYLPSEVYLGLTQYLADQHIEAISVGFNQQGLDKIIDHVLGPDGLFKEKKSFFDVFHRRVAREAASVEEELRQINQSLHIKSRHEREIHGEVWFSIFGHEVNYFYFNETLFEDFFRDGFIGVPDIQDILKKVPSFSYTHHSVEGTTTLVLPSQIGFPIFLSHQDANVLYYKNDEFKLEVSPSVFAEDRNHEAPSTINVHAKGHFIHDTSRLSITGIILNFEHTSLGVGLKRRSYLNLPIDADLTLDLKDWKVTWKSTPVLPTDIIHISCHPFTFNRDYMNHENVVLEPQFLPYWKNSEMAQVNESYLHEYLGYGVEVKAKYGELHYIDNPGQFHKFWAEHTLDELYYLLYFNPHLTSYDLVVSLTAAEHDPTDQMELVLNFDYHENKDNNPYHSELFGDHQQNLEEYTQALADKKFVTHTYVVKGELERKGTKERKAIVEATYTHSCDDTLQKYSFYYDRTPYTASETEHFKICMDALVLFPHYDLKKLHDLDTLDLDKQVNALMMLTFGNDCKNDKKIIVHGVLKRSEEQVQLESQREVLDHLHFNPYSHYYHKCKEEHARGAYYDDNCRWYIYWATLMHHLDIDIKYESELTPEFINSTRKFFSYLDHKFYHYMDQNYQVEEHRGKIDLHFNFSVLHDTVDIELVKRFAVAHYHDVPLAHGFEAVSASPYLSFMNNDQFDAMFHSFCSEEGEYVKTFDNVTYHLPPIDCWKVLAKDCSEHEYFLVLGKSISHDKYAKALKVFLGKTKVEVLPGTDDSELVVRVNGKEVDVKEDKPYLHHLEGVSEETVFYVGYNGLYYTIDYDDYGVTVFYDGKAIVTELSRFYSGKQCGLCGDFNHEHDREFRGPEDCVYHNATEFAAAYAIHEDGCHAPEVKHSGCEDAHEDPDVVIA